MTTYVSLNYSDGTGFTFDCDEIVVHDNHIITYDEAGEMRDVIPFSNLKVLSIISEEEYVALLEDDDG